MVVLRRLEILVGGVKYIIPIAKAPDFGRVRGLFAVCFFLCRLYRSWQPLPQMSSSRRATAPLPASCLRV